MSHSLFDDMEVPDEMDMKLPTERKLVNSPKTKSSKLCLDKGFVKKQDRVDFMQTCK